MLKAEKYWGNDWILTYDLVNAPGVSKRDIADASDNKLKVTAKWEKDPTSYNFPSTVLWAKRDTFSTMEQVQRAFYQAFNSIKPKGAMVEKLLILDFADKNIYIENN